MKLLMILLATVSMACAQSNIYPRVKVIGDRVSLRPEPHTDCEVLDRAMRGEELIYINQTNDWIAVQAPSNLNFWVFGEYVDNGVVLPKKLNVRSGPSQNYNVVTIALRDEELQVRGEFNGWLKIAPPKGSRVWISADFTEIIEAPKPKVVPEPEAVPEPEPSVAAEPVEEETADVEDQPLMLILDESKPQGKIDRIPGVLRRANPGLYKLVLIADGMEEPICLVRGKESQLERYLNRTLLIEGPLYWVKDVDLPVIQPNKIHLDPILSE